MARTWFTTADRRLIDWSTDVVNGLAAVTIYRLVDAPGTDNDPRYMWASRGSRVSPTMIATARAQASADPLPGAYQPPAPPVGGGGASSGGTPVSNSDVASFVTSSGATRAALDARYATVTALAANGGTPGPNSVTRALLAPDVRADLAASVKVDGSGKIPAGLLPPGTGGGPAGVRLSTTDSGVLELTNGGN